MTVLLFENLDFCSLFSPQLSSKGDCLHFAVFSKDDILGTYILRSLLSPELATHVCCCVTAGNCSQDPMYNWGYCHLRKNCPSWGMWG